MDNNEDYSLDVIQLESRARLAGPNVAKNSKIITPNDEQCEIMLHMSTDIDVKEFIPIIGSRQSKSEDRTTPRVCVAPTLLGCVLGYMGLTSDQVGKSGVEGGYLGGWKIYGFKYQACLCPNKNLVPDQARSGEHWLVTYSDTTRAYKPFEAGKFFWVSTTQKNVTGRYPEVSTVFMFEVKHSDGIWFSKNIKLGIGHWRIEGPGNFDILSKRDAGDVIKSWEDDSRYTVTKIGRGEYHSAKKVSAGLLSLDSEPCGYQATPNFIKW